MSNRNQIVNPNSVQSQFAALVRDKENLQKQSTSAENERRLEESKLQNLRAVQSTLSEKVRIAHANLGIEAKKKQMLTDETMRLKKVLEDDRIAIEDMTNKVKNVEGTIVEKKFQFVKEMDGLNDELADALRMYEERSIERSLGSMKSCQAVQKYLLEKLQQQNLAGDQSWKNIFHSIDQAVVKLETNQKDLEKEKTSFLQLNEKSKEMRERVEKKHSKSLGKMELDELETLWEENQEVDMQSSDLGLGNGITAQPVNMHLFYGNALGGINDETNPAVTAQDYDMVQVE